MTPRERVMKTLAFEIPDRLPKDLGGMASTGISAFAYPRLVEALDLPARLPRVHDTAQMLALPDLDVLDALGCDVVAVHYGVTNALEESEKWHEYDFDGRLPARVQNPSDFRTLDDGTIVQPKQNFRMPPSSYVFDAAHGGQPITWDALPMDPLDQVRRELEEALLRDEQIAEIVDHCRRAREATDRAILYAGPINVVIGIGGRSGIGIHPVLCLAEPAYVADLHELTTEYALKNIHAVLPEISPYIDILMMAADDWGTQNSLIASPKIFRSLYQPYLRRMNDTCHALAPEVRLFLHSCGAIYDLIDDMIECGFDILNPVQWPAGGHSFAEWKDKTHGRIALWGGGVNSQETLPHGSVRDVEDEVARVVRCLGAGGGYVFNSIHNLLAETAPDKIIAMYQAAARV